MERDFFQDAPAGVAGCQSHSRRGRRGIHDQPGNVEGRARSARRLPVRAEAFRAPARSTSASDMRVVDAAADVQQLRGFVAAGASASHQERTGRADAGSRAPGGRCRRSRCSERPPRAAGVDPEGEDALVGLAELSGAGQHAAAVDPDREIRRSRRTPGPALPMPAWCCRRARAGARCERFSADALRRKARLGRSAPNPARRHRLATSSGNVGQRRDGVDAAGAEQDEAGAHGACRYSSMLTVPSRLCSISWRLLVLPSTPASTLGLAAASITQSTGGRPRNR